MRNFIFINSKGFYLHALKAPSDEAEDTVAVVKEGLVVEATTAAEAWGVTTGISKILGQRRCPQLICVEFDLEKCQSFYDRHWSVFAEITPQVEPTALHQGFLDVTGCNSRHKTIEKLMLDAANYLMRNFGITCNWGGGQDRWIARLACSGNSMIAPEEEAEFLKRVSIKRLLPDDLCTRLLRYSVRNVAELLALPRHFMETHLQISARLIQPFLFRDSSTVRSLFPPPQIEAEADNDWLRTDDLDNTLADISQRCAARLAEFGLEACALKAEFRSYQGRHHYLETQSSHPFHTGGQIRRFLSNFILEKQLRRLERINVILSRLTPRVTLQSDLWHDPIKKMEQNERLQQTQERVKRSHSTVLLTNGRELMNCRRPRFAQLIYEQRGIYLP